ncbi:methionyl-tRNA formyltransferase [Aquimarina agarilytica]|uniref:methionyl-tRNA formyltransferase n=1 Tax=Aquimarina agarilytica TaxID=1087449 RepID=UPI0002887FC2|nr:methionyl-tRNA formyltransferase [Aquimarina agarilytica]
MKKLKIVFMGTPDFAVATLKSLVENEYNVVGVITAPDRPAGRGQKLRASAVKTYADSVNLPILQPTNLKAESFLEALKALEADLQIIVAFRMLPKVVWAMPRLGTFNLHASLLPEYRGAAPINWAVINGETVTGNTTFFIDEKIDTGNVILQQQIPISNTDNAGALHDRLMLRGAQLVLQTVDLIEKGEVQTTAQPEKEPKTAYKLTKENTKIDWSLDGKIIYNLVRGLSPYPSAWCYLNDKNKKQQVKILNVSFEKELHNETVGALKIVDKKICIFVKDGCIYVNKMQLPGKKAMEVKDLLNGYSFDEDAYLM